MDRSKHNTFQAEKRKERRKLKFKVFLFDLGGTLVNSREGVEKAIKFVIDEVCRREIDYQEVIDFWWSIWNKIRPLGGKVIEKIYKMIAELRDFIGIKSISDKELIDLFYQAEIANTNPFPEVIDVLRKLKSLNFKLGIVSNCSIRWGTGIIKKCGLEGFFEVILISDREGISKPDPAIFQRALDLLNAESRETMMIGDDPKYDVPGAKSLGIYTCLVSRGKFLKFRSKKEVPDFIIHDLRGIFSII